MQIFILFSFSVLLLQGIVFQSGILPSLVADALAGAALLVMGGTLLRYRRVDFPAKYILWGLVFSMLVVIGWIVNSESAGAAATGLRFYFTGFIFFLLPLVYRFSQRELSHQLMFLLLVGMLQAPVTLLQRFVWYRNSGTGDVIVGTLGAHSSGALSTFLSIELAILVTFFVKRRIKLPMFLVGVALLFVPTTLNETKVMLIYMPIIFLGPYVFSGAFAHNKGRLAVAAAGFGIAVAVFSVIYQYTMVDLYGRSGMDLSRFTTVDGVTKFVSSYLAPQTTADEDDELGDGPKMVGRIDQIVIPLQRLARDPVTLLVGYGVGNVSKSPLDGFSGAWLDEAARYTKGSSYLSKIIWEMGLLGVFLLASLLVFVYRDASYVARWQEGIFADFALAWKTVMIVLVLGIFYKSILTHTAVAPVLWFYLGLIVSLRARLESRRCYAESGFALQN